MKCPQCGSALIRQGRRSGLREFLLGLLTIYPFCCQLCTHRFQAFLGQPRANPRREYQRVPIRFQAALRPTVAGDNMPVMEGTLINLSMTGCSIATTAPAKKGTGLHLWVEIKDQEPAVEVDLAKVTWTNSKRMGLKFLKIKPEHEICLRAVMESRLHGQPH